MTRLPSNYTTTMPSGELQLRGNSSTTNNKAHVPRRCDFHSLDFRSLVHQKACCFAWQNLDDALQSRKRHSWEIDLAAVLWRSYTKQRTEKTKCTVVTHDCARGLRPLGDYEIAETCSRAALTDTSGERKSFSLERQRDLSNAVN